MSFSYPENEQRAHWAAQALQTFKEVTGTDEDDVIGDFLCNLMHLCRQDDIDFLAHLNQGALHFQAEIEIEEEGEEADPSACAANPHHYQRHDGMAPVEEDDDPEDETIDGDFSEPDDEFCVFDPESPEGRAVADGRMNADGTTSWHSVAFDEGWNIYRGDDRLHLSKRDHEDKFDSDQEVWRHVFDKAAAGSAPHIAALEYLKRESPTEYGEIIGYCS